MRRIATIRSFAVALALPMLALPVLAFPTIASAQQWPTAKPITIIQPFAAGSDHLARLTAAALEQRLGQRVVVENRPGAGGATGTAYAARQRPDGYTLVMALPGPAANATNTHPGLTYKPLEDFDHVARLVTANMAFTVRKDFPANNLQELVAYAKAHPGAVSVGNNGVGSQGHMLALLLAEKAGIKFKFVPYRGSPQIVTDMMSGSLDMSSDFFGPTYVQQTKAGGIKPIAVPAEKRSPIAPETQTFREAGYDLVVTPWQGIMAPKGTPRPIIDKINAALADFLATPEAQEKLGAVGQQPAMTTPEAFHDIVVREEAMWRDIITTYSIRSE